MKDDKMKHIDFSRSRLGRIADKYYNAGNYVLALRFAYAELEESGGDGEVYARLADIYENMGLHGSAINWLYRYLDIAEDEELPDVYEAIAVNYLSMGQEAQSAYYYNRLIDVDESLPDETKLDIAKAFSHDKKSAYRFVYPPNLADYSKEIDLGSLALKNGDCKRAIGYFSKVEKGAKEYATAQEMQAVAHLLEGDEQTAKEICERLLDENPNDMRALATLSAILLEQGDEQTAREIAEKLCQMPQENTDDLYKVATVCCENGLHKQAYEKFCLLEEKLAFDGRMLYFKAVSAYKSGLYKDAERAFDLLCSVYPDAEVSKFYLQSLREYNQEIENGNQNAPLPIEPSYFYHLPQEEREERCRLLLKLKEFPVDEAKLFGLLAWRDGYLAWCFDEMDGGDHDLQYLALVSAEHIRADDFIREVLLDDEVLDMLKVETLRMLLERNENRRIGVVLCHIYRKVVLLKIAVGRKKRKRFVEAHAKVASKFIVINDGYGEKMKRATETLYQSLEKLNSLDSVQSSDDLACAILVLSEIKEMRGDLQTLAKAFDADVERVQMLVTAVEYCEKMQNEQSIKE